MFIGRYYHTLEEKKRVSLPKKFRKQHTKWVITRGLDGGLFLFPQQDFDNRLEELKERTFTKKHDRDFLRLMANEAQQITADSLGRVLLPKYLIAYAGLKKNLVITGSFSYIEIWDRDRYHQYNLNLEKQAEKISETIAKNL